MGPLLAFARGIDRVNDAVYAAIRWLTLAMILLGAFNALARYLTKYTGLNLASNAYIDLQWYMFSLIFLLGAAYGLNREAHVRVDVLYSRVSARARAWIDLAGTALFLIPFCVVMLWASWPAVRNSWAVRETSPDPGGLIRYPIKTLLLVSFTLLLLQALAQLVKKAAGLAGRVPLDDGGAAPAPDHPGLHAGQPEGV
jgi:TRAP-type mannitol/chloroaromatic compound transport system permease small subunit